MAWKQTRSKKGNSSAHAGADLEWKWPGVLDYVIQNFSFKIGVSLTLNTCNTSKEMGLDPVSLDTCWFNLGMPLRTRCIIRHSHMNTWWVRMPVFNCHSYHEKENSCHKINSPPAFSCQKALYTPLYFNLCEETTSSTFSLWKRIIRTEMTYTIEERKSGESKICVRNCGNRGPRKFWQSQVLEIAWIHLRLQILVTARYCHEDRCNICIDLRCVRVRVRTQLEID